MEEMAWQSYRQEL